MPYIELVVLQRSEEQADRKHAIPPDPSYAAIIGLRKVRNAVLLAARGKAGVDRQYPEKRGKIALWGRAPLKVRPCLGCGDHSMRGRYYCRRCAELVRTGQPLDDPSYLTSIGGRKRRVR